MNQPQVTPESAFHASQSSQLLTSGDACPSCGQAIPAEKLEEMRGKIALRERDQALAITTKLQQQYEIEKARAVAKANADLDLERRQSAAREVHIRKEVELAAATSI